MKNEGCIGILAIALIVGLAITYWYIILPIVLVIIGMYFLVKASEKKDPSKENKDSIKNDDYTNTINTSNLYSNKNHNFKDNNYYPSTPYYPEIDDDLNIRCRLGKGKGRKRS